MIIYVATNKINGKKYVGLTKRSLRERWTQHKYIASNGAKTYFHKALIKYGFEAFDIVPVVSALKLEYLPLLEMDLIQELRPEYNQTCGGEATFGRKFSAESIEKIRKANTGKKRTDEHKANYSKIKKDQLAANPELRGKLAEHLRQVRSKIDEQKRRQSVSKASKGRVWSEESKKKLSLSKMGQVHTPEMVAQIAAKNRKPIICSNGSMFTCREEAARITGISLRSIARVCNGEYPSVKGLKFSYYRSLA